MESRGVWQGFLKPFQRTHLFQSAHLRRASRQIQPCLGSGEPEVGGRVVAGWWQGGGRVVAGWQGCRLAGRVFLAWTKNKFDSLGGCAIMGCRQSAKQNETKRNRNLPYIRRSFGRALISLLRLTQKKNTMNIQTQKLPRLNRALIRAGVPSWASSSYAEEMRRAYKGAQSYYAGPRLQRQREFLKNGANDPLRLSLRERVKLGNPIAILQRIGKDSVGGLVAFEIECKFDAGRRDALKLPAMAGRAHAEHDGFEVPILCRWGDLRPLRDMCAQFRALGATTTKSFGGHVHLDARDMMSGTQVTAQLKRRINSRLVPGVEKILRWCVPHSRIGNTYCELGGACWSENTRYRAVNVCSLRKQQTIEIRLGSATLNPEKWRLWAEACLYFFRAPMSAGEIRGMADITTAAAAAAWIMRSGMSNELKWWLLMRLRKFHPLAIPTIKGTENEGGE